MIKTLVYPVRSDAWYSDVVTFDAAWSWCVDGVLYVLEELQPIGFWIFLH